MGLKYPFREVFRRKILRPKRLWAVLEELDARLSDATGSDTGFASDISALKITVGDASSGLVKDVTDLKNHNVTLAELGLTTAEAVITYEDDSTETVTFIILNSD